MSAKALCTLCAALLLSRPSLAEFDITSPTVEERALEFELFGQRSFDNRRIKNNEQQHRFEIAYGVNSWWQTGVEMKVKKEPRSNVKYNAASWENVIQLTSQEKYWLDLGLKLEYEHSVRHADADEIGVKLLLEKEIEPLVVTANLNFARAIGQNAGKGIEFGYALRAKYSWKRELEAGVEAFGEPGRLSGFASLSEQEHVIGPVVLGKFDVAGVPGSVNYTAGYLFALTSGTSRGTAKWKLQYEIPF